MEAVKRNLNTESLGIISDMVHAGNVSGWEEDVYGIACNGNLFRTVVY